jgi:hypothetical protein
MQESIYVNGEESSRCPPFAVGDHLQARATPHFPFARRGANKRVPAFFAFGACTCSAFAITPPPTPSPSPRDNSFHSPCRIGSPGRLTPLYNMEPPPKRLRILQSVEVDEEDPEYIKAKQKQQQKFKGRLESIFAKYESMHESMSDEIDMRNNEVVVDRGHLRRLVRQVNRKETMLLDTLGLEAEKPGSADGTDEDREAHEESEDELAPTQQPNTRTVRQLTEKRKRQHSTAQQDAHIQHSDNDHPIIDQTDTPASVTTRNGPYHIPNTPNPASNLLQLVQFPETPAGQQAQTTFYATLAQTINHAVQQAVAPLFQGILPTTPSVQLPFAPALPAPTTPVTVNDKLAPATDPKWFFPPMSANNRKPQPDMSSPVSTNMVKPSKTANRLSNAITSPLKKSTPRSAAVESVESEITVSNAEPLVTEEMSRITPRQRSPRVVVQRRQQDLSKSFQFTEDDDIYISKRKELQRSTWAAIRNGRQKWRGWPLDIFEQRWEQHIKGKKLYLTGKNVTKDRTAQTMVDPETHVPSTNHLPTPSSSEYEDTRKEANELYEEQPGDGVPSSSYFDDDERDLLSLAGDDVAKEQSPVEPIEEEEFYPAADDIILPSIEPDEDSLQQNLLEESTPVPASASTLIKAEPQHSSPISKRKTKPLPIHFEAVPDTETEEEDENNLSSQPLLPVPHNHNHNKRPRSASLDLIGGDDDLLAPTTPHIKREFSTPPPSHFLFSSPAARTPKAPLEHSSSSKSLSKLDRKAYLKRVKQSWTKKASTPGPRSAGKRASFNVLPPRMRADVHVGEAESEDELAM